ncbi:MAG: DUF488 domain-containing protein [Anaerolineae bacterium]
MTDPIPIYTIGYGARSVEALLAVLQTWQIAFVIDIRSAPYSRFKPEFSKESLAREIERRHIRYLYMGDLLGGRPADPACYRDGKVDYDLVKQTAAYQEGIGRLCRAFAQQRRVVLLCSEGRPEECHRSKLIGESLTSLDIPVIHLDENDQPLSHAAVIARLTGGQLGLFGAPTFTSRKRYQATDDDDDDEDGDMDESDDGGGYD